MFPVYFQMQLVRPMTVKMMINDTSSALLNQSLSVVDCRHSTLCFLFITKWLV